MSSAPTVPAGSQARESAQKEQEQLRADVANYMKCVVFLAKIRSAADRCNGFSDSSKALEQIKLVIESMSDTVDEAPGSGRIFVPAHQLVYSGYTASIKQPSAKPISSSGHWDWGNPSASCVYFFYSRLPSAPCLPHPQSLVWNTVLSPNIIKLPRIEAS